MAFARPSMLDRMIASVAPAFATRRVAARSAFETISAIGNSGAPTDPGGRIWGGGGYRGGQSDRRQTRGWKARVRSANQDSAKRLTLIARSRDAAMNMPLATAAIERNVTFTIGTGLMAFPDLDAAALGITPEAAEALTQRIARDYDAYMSSLDPDAERTATGYDLQAILLRGMLESGDMLALRCMPEGQIGRVHETSWKLLEADRLASPLNHVEGERLGGNGNVCVFGVEQDNYSAPHAFHVLKKAPSYGRQGNDTTRIPAWGAASQLPTAMLLFEKKRAEQARGVPILAPVLEVLRQVSDATDAELMATVMQGMLAVIYKSPGASAMPEPEYDNPENPESMVSRGGWNTGTMSEAGAAQNYRFEAGTVLELDSDAEVDLKTPGRPNPAYDKFFEAVGTQIGAALQTPFEVLMARFNSSYTASRASLELFYKRIVQLLDWMSGHWCTPGYQCWLFEQVAKGIYDMPGFLDDLRRRALWSSVRHRGDGKISLDPAREAKALETHEAHGWKTGQQITAELTGGDFDANVKRRGIEHKAFLDAGLPIPNAKGGGNDIGASTDNGGGGNASQD